MGDRGPRGRKATYVGSLVARAIEGGRGKGLRLVLSSSHGRMCISIRVIAAGTFFFFDGACVFVGLSPQALSFLVSLPLVFFLFRCCRFLFLRSVAAAGFHILAAGVFFL